MCREGAWGLRFDVEKDGEQPETAAFLLYIIVIVHGSEAAPEGSTGDGWPTLRGDALLNRFFASESILAKELNARCLNDALWQGRDGKKSVLHAGPQRSASGQPRPSGYSIARFHAYKNADRFCQRFFVGFVRPQCPIVTWRQGGRAHKRSVARLRQESFFTRPGPCQKSVVQAERV